MKRDAVDDFTTFYRRAHADQVRRAFLLVGRQAVADEVVHDAFVAVYERWDEIRDPDAYLNRAVIHACRRVGRRRRLVDVARDRDVVGDGPREAVRQVDDEVELATILVGLPFRQRAAIVLRFYVGLTEREIAGVLGCRPGTVGPAIHRGLKKLRKELE